MVAELLTARRIASKIARRLRPWRDHVLHPLMRRRAIRAVSHAPPYQVLVICYGNVCRSPFAAAALRRALAPLGAVVASAGLVGHSARAPDHARTAARKWGVSLDAHEAKGLSPELLRSSDLLVVMDVPQQRALRERYGVPQRKIVLLGDFDSEPVEQRGIADPIDQPLETFEQCYARIDRCVDMLAASVINGWSALAAGNPVRWANRMTPVPTLRTPALARRQASTMPGATSSTQHSS